MTALDRVAAVTGIGGVVLLRIGWLLWPRGGVR